MSPGRVSTSRISGGIKAGNTCRDRDIKGSSSVKVFANGMAIELVKAVVATISLSTGYRGSAYPLDTLNGRNDRVSRLKEPDAPRCRRESRQPRAK